MAFKGFEIETRDDGENSVVPMWRHNHALSMAGQQPAGPDEWFGVILADHGLVGTFCTSALAKQFLELAAATA